MRLALAIALGCAVYVVAVVGCLWLVRRAAPRDITIGRDQNVGERLARLRAMQPADTDVLRKAHPRLPAPDDEESRRALDRLKGGW